MNIPIAAWASAGRKGLVDSFLAREAFDAAAEEAAAAVLGEVREKGEKAVLEACRRFDKVEMQAGELRVAEAEIDTAFDLVPRDAIEHIAEAHRRVREFSERSLREKWSMGTEHGGMLGETYIPFERVGLYIPGGTAPLASTIVMTATLAQVAGVGRIVACTPCAPDKSVNPVMLCAMRMTGVGEIYRVGGIQAIGLMAYGTRDIEPVQKIAGPGGAYVTAAKRQVYGDVALDLVAGPSEIAILADETARPEWVAADLLSQIEHGTGHEKALLATDHPELAAAVKAELEKQTARLPRCELIRKSIDAGGIMLATVENLEEGLELINQFAPEHLEIMVESPERWHSRRFRAGAVFFGEWTPESVGDFVAGPSHVLPTGGAAKRFSGLTVDDFRRRVSLVHYTRRDLGDALPTIEAFGAMEGLEAHARSARIRFTEHS